MSKADTLTKLRIRNEIDIKNQVLSDFYLHRKNAIYLKNSGHYWDGLDEFRTLLSGVPLSLDNYVHADKIIKEIDKIESDSHNLKDSYHEGIRSLGYFQKTHRNNVARRVFNSVLRRITLILQAEGYLDMDLIKSNTKFFDPSDNKKSGERFKK